MTTLRQAAEQALISLERADKISGHANNKATIATLRQALEADTKPCACCGDGNSRLSVTRICDTCGSEYAGQAEMDMAKRIEAAQQAEQPAQPVAWIEHEWSGSGLRHLHFDRREPSVRDEVMRPVWMPLYTHPQPAQQPLTGEQIKTAFLNVDLFEEGDELLGYEVDITRAIEAMHGIGGDHA